MAANAHLAQLIMKQPPSHSSGAQLAILHAGQREDRIRVSLIRTLDLIATEYDCVSYDRSQEYGYVNITVDGHDMAIQTPLESALRGLRRPDVSQILWADLLTGNSAAERSLQALDMKQIVENAASTIICLGPRNDGHTKGAFDHFANNGKQIPTSLSPLWFASKPITCHGCPDDGPSEFFALQAFR